jgi:c-di-GMP-binding flagellar brake protein YcgR
VFAEFSSSEALFRVQGMLEVLIRNPAPVVCLLTPFETPEAVQRRQWVRVRTVLPVEVDCLADDEAENDIIEGENVVRTVSLDLSGGGIRLRDGKGIEVGSELTMVVELPSGPIEVKGVVLEIQRNGDARVRFLNPPESARGRIVRHVFDVQMEIRRSRPTVLK